MNQTSQTNLSITPLGAGDLIDRAVRFYRQNFWIFVWIAAPPVIIGTVISVGWTIIGRFLFSVGSIRNPDDLVPYYLFVWLGGIIIWLVQTIATLAVMGGASRNFVRHLLFGEPITFSETYKNVKKRIGGLTAASFLITVFIGITGTVIFYFGLIIGFIVVGFTAYALSFFPIVAFIVGLALGLTITFGTFWLIFLVVSRFAYIPQVMLVEGLGVFPAIGRSASLASGNVKRLMALFAFTTIATYLALLLFYIPLNWYAWANGVEIMAFQTQTVPAWYEIANQLIWQFSWILLMPVWMIGLCLLYVDERVRHEGYDIELMAARRLGEIPDVPQAYINPLQPALSNQVFVQPESLPNSPKKKESSNFTSLGLE
jgi:hypothetical protein